MFLIGAIMVATVGWWVMNHRFEPSHEVNVDPVPSAEPPPPDFQKLSIVDISVGTGQTAEPGDTVDVKYTGMFVDGGVFDSSEQHDGKPLNFVVGGGRMIKGFDEGVRGMKVGGKRKLEVPSAMGYGAKGARGRIAPNTPLKFEIELAGVTKKPGAEP